MVDLYREKSRKLAQAQKLYDILKNKFQAKEMETAASVDVNHTLKNIDAERRPEPFNNVNAVPLNHRLQGDCDRRSLPGQFPGPVEQLHSHQKSGSSVLGREPAALAQSDRFKPNRLRELYSLSIYYLSSHQVIARLETRTTPGHRLSLPGTATIAANRSQIPTATTRTHLQPAHDVSSAQRRPPIPAHRDKPSTSSRVPGGVISGIKIGNGGTPPAIDPPTRFDQYRGRSGLPEP